MFITETQKHLIVDTLRSVVRALDRDPRLAADDLTLLANLLLDDDLETWTQYRKQW